MSDEKDDFFHRLEWSAVLTVVGILLLFSSAIATIVIAPNFIDPSWVQPTSYFQEQMYKQADPNFYIARASPGSDTLEYVHHLKKGETLLAFQENEVLRIQAPPELEKFVTRFGDEKVKLTSDLLLLRTPTKAPLQPGVQWLELYDPGVTEAFSVAGGDGTDESFIGSHYTILDATVQKPFHKDPGVIYVKNPQEYRFSESHHYDPQGQVIRSLEELRGKELGFRSRAELIRLGEKIYAAEGCWYCHTDQTRTLIQDTVLNGSEVYAAPPSSANEYIYQKITFPGTRRIGPDLSRVGIKRPSRDWHKSHFWAPKTASIGSIMPAFRHFFDNDPRGTSLNVGIPNYQFEAMFQYLMTKGTRITPPTQSWWKGKDPIQTTQIIEGHSPHGK